MTLLRVLRKQAGISMSELSRRSYVSTSYISQIERRACNDPHPQVLETLAKALGWTENPTLLLSKVPDDWQWPGAVK